MAELDSNTPEPTPNEPQFSEAEQRALDQGWVPQDEWSGSPDDWRDAKAFLDRGELFKKIDDQKRELKQVRATMEEFGKHHARVKQLAYEQALRDLKAQKKEALEDNDADRVVEIDDRIAETREAQKSAANEPAPVAQNQPQGPNPDFVRWQARNAWYSSDRAMKAVADEIARDMVGRGETEVTRILSEVDKEVRKAFPTKFENPNRQRAGSVDGTPARGGRPVKDEVVLTDAERRIMNRILETGAITKEKYLAEFKATRVRGE